ncbi:MAG: sigma-70 family RNA polymerase sigma factor [Acholeplasmatales bacterium]|nr:sigma-70 family RNA polymerase sigma factor [Acholeplasmatales bacterium]
MSLEKDVNINSDLDKLFEKYYKTYSKLVYFVVNRLIEDEIEAEDLTNEVFLNFFEKYKNEKIRNVKGYLTASARNMSITFLNKKNKMVIDNEYINNLSDNNEKSYYHELIKSFKKLLNDLELEIVIDHIVYDVKLSTIAKEKGVSNNTIKSIYRRALNKLKKGLNL